MIRLIKPYIEFNEVNNEFKEIFQSGIFTRGKYSAQLPLRINEYTGCKHSFLTSSATTALSMCLEILNIGEGDEVIVSDFSFPASVNVIEACRAKPVFADVNIDTYNMDTKQLKKKINSKTRAVIFVSSLGNPSGINEIKEICAEADLPLINDAACAIGSGVYGKKVGNIADLECFSFHPRKLLTSGEGGAITTNSDEYAEILKVKLMHGSIPLKNRVEFITYGYNYRLPELQCVMLIKQIAKLDGIIAQRVNICEEYKSELEPLGFIAQQHTDDIIHNMQSIVFTVPTEIDRDALIISLKEAGIETTIGTYCLSNCRYYREKYNEIQVNSKFLEDNTITLPCFEGVDVNTIVEEIKNVMP